MAEQISQGVTNITGSDADRVTMVGEHLVQKDRNSVT